MDTFNRTDMTMDRYRTFLLDCAKYLIDSYVKVMQSTHRNMWTMQHWAMYALIDAIDFDNDPMPALISLQKYVCVPTLDLGFTVDHLKIVLRLLTEDIPYVFPLEVQDKNHYFETIQQLDLHLDNVLSIFRRRTYLSHKDLELNRHILDELIWTNFTYTMLVKNLESYRRHIYQNLLRCGDVEANPGPVMSKFAISESGLGYKAQMLFPSQVDHNVTVSLDGTMTDFIGNLTRNVDEKISNTRYYVSTACKLFLILNNLNNKTNLAAIFIDMLVSWNVNFNLAQKAWTFLCEHCSALLQPGYLAQMVSDAMVRAIAMMVTCIMAVVGTMALPSQELINIILKRTGDIGRATQGFKTIIEALGGVFNNIYDVIYEYLLGVPPSDQSLDRLLEDFREWFLEVDDLSKLSIMDSIPVSYKDCRRIERAYHQGLDCIKNLDRMKVSGQHREPFTRYWTVIAKIYERVIAYGARKAEPRTEPVIIRVFGEAGCGKSGLIFLLAQDLCAIEGMAENFMDELYFRNQVQEFWDGYFGQMITVIDDFGQVKDSLGNVNKEFLEVIRCKNIAKWPLYMATLEQKARTDFVSRAVILTSNKLVYETPSITCPEALKRRMDITVECRIKQAYRKGPHDPKLNTDKVESSMDPNVYEFVVYDGDKPTDITLDYDQFSEFCCSQYRKAWKTSQDRIEALRVRGRKLHAEYLSKYKAQVHSGKYSLDQCINPALWLLARSGTHTDVGHWILRDKLLKQNQMDDLVAVACNCDCYNDFMVEVYSYCVEHGVDLLTPVETGYDYASLSTFIYDEQLTYNKRIANQKRYATSLFERLRETIKNYYDSIKKGPGLALMTLGGIVTGLLAMYSFKRTFLDKKKSKPRSFKPIDTVDAVPGFSHSVESRDEKRPAKRLRSEGCRVESRDEKRPRKNLKAEFSILPSFLRNNAKCTCDPISIAKLCKHSFKENLKKYLDDEAYKCDGKNLCMSCFNYDQDKWLTSITNVIQELHLSCDVHDDGWLADDVFEEFKYGYHEYLAQALMDINSRELAVGPVAGNLYKLCTNTPKGWKERVNALFVRGTIILTVKHVKDWLSEECMLRNQFVPDGLMFRKSECQFIDLTNRNNDCVDAMLIVLPDSINAHRDLVSKFTDTVDINQFNSSPGSLIHLRNMGSRDKRTTAFCQYVIRSINAIDQEQYTMTDIDGREIPYIVRDGYEYYAETEEGDCGSPLLLSNTRIKGKIIGIHVAGAANRTECSALATPVTKNMIERALTQVREYRAHVAVQFDNTGTCTLPPGNFIPIGKSDNTLPAPTKTQYSKSPIHHDMLEYRASTKKPALLRKKVIDGVEVDPLMKGLSKCGGVSPLIDRDLMDRCVDAVASFLSRNRDATLRGPLNVEQAIRGIPGDPYISSINRTSSPGIPWIFHKTSGKPGKQQWLGSGNELDIDNPELLERLRLRLEMALNGERMETIWADTLKDELRPNSKVDVGKTRVFSAGPMDYVIFMRQYYLPFFAHMMYNRIDNFCAVGINPFDLDWHKLALKLQSFGVHVIDGDFENFDGTELATFLWGVCKIINKVENDGHDRIRIVIFSDIVNSIHMHGDNLYAWTHSLTSGNPGTAIINTIYNILTMVYVFCKCTCKPPIDFFKLVYMAAYGDDNVLCISDKIIKSFNMQTISHQYSQMGMKYTDASKSDTIIPYRTLREISFLKRDFRHDQHLMRYVAPLQLDTILEMVMWVTHGNDANSLCCSNIERAYYELALHGRDTFTEWSTILDAVARKRLRNPPILGNWLDYIGVDFGY